MRFLILGSAAILLSGCSFLGLSGSDKTADQYISQAGYYGQAASYGQQGSYGQYGSFGQAASAGQSAVYGQAAPVEQVRSYAQPTYNAQAACNTQSTYAVQTSYHLDPACNTQPTYIPQQPVVQPVAAPRCHTGNCLARWNLEGGIGAVFPVGRNILTPSRTNNVAGTDFNSVSFNDAYDAGFRAELGGSYALAPNTKVTLLGHYEKADSNGPLDLGTINGDAFTGALTDYEAYGVELGLRQYFAPQPIPVLNSIRPYVEGRVGVSHVDDISLVGAELAGAPFSAGPIPLYEDSWVGTAAGLVGVETPIARFTTIGLETGVRYQGGLQSDTSVLAAGTAIGGLNNNRGRLSIPVTLRGRYRF